MGSGSRSGSGSRLGSGSCWVAVVERLFLKIHSLGSGSRFGSGRRFGSGSRSIRQITQLNKDHATLSDRRHLKNSLRQTPLNQNVIETDHAIKTIH